MKFTFKKHILTIFMLNIIIIVLFFGVVYFYSLRDLFISYLILTVGGISLLSKMIYYYFLIFKFLKKHSKNERKEFEKQLSHVLLKYSDCCLTENYIFSMETFVYITYNEIVCLTPSRVTTIDRGISGFGKKTLLYLKSGKKYTIRTSFFTTAYHFAKIVKKKNPNIFIGDIKEYRKEKKNIEYLEKLKSKTRVWY